MKLTQDHIQELYKFTRAHYVEYYDLQTELVDHLANGIESQWKQNSSLNFDEAKQKEFEKFGIYGFVDVIAARRKTMDKKYRAIIRGYFNEWWSFPKIALSSMAVLIVFITLRLVPTGDAKFLSVSILVLLISMLMRYRVMQLKRFTEGIERKWLLQELIYNQGLDMAQGFLFIPFYFVMLGNKSGFLENFYGQLIFSFLLVAVLLSFVISAVTIPSKAEELLAETYPEYKID